MPRPLASALVLASILGTGLGLGAVACGGESSGPKVVAGAPAGDVFDIHGVVTATRDGQTRTLARGDAVSGDDVIDTGAGGHVAIRLRHNLVPWTLGPGKKEQVAMSLAWKAPRSTQTVAGPTGERSGAAGRHAEREAADTAATAATAGAEAMAPEAAAAPGAAPVAAPGAAPAAAPPPAPDPSADDAPIEHAKVAPLAGAGDDEHGALLGDAVGDSFGTGGLGLSGTGEGGGGTGEGSIGLGSVGTIGKGAGTGQGQGYGAGGGARGARAKPSPSQGIVRIFAAKGGLDTSVVARVVRARNPRLLACVEPDAPARAMVKLTIKPDGKVDTVTVSGVSRTASQCLEKWMRATAFPQAKNPTTASVLVQGADPLDGL